MGLNSMKSLKGQSESLNQRRTDNAMAKRKRTPKTLHRKQKIEQHEPRTRH